MTGWEMVAVAAAGLAAGGMNAVLGSGTLVSFPVLLAVGLPPVTATISNSLGLVAGGLTGSFGYRRELRGQRPLLLKLLPASVLGALTGAYLLLHLPAASFEAIVPVLIGVAVVLVAVQPLLQRTLGARDPADAERPVRGGRLVALVTGAYATGSYGGYFAASQGVLQIGIFGLVLRLSIQRLNALKNVLTLAVNVVAAGTYVIVATDRVDWRAAGCSPWARCSAGTSAPGSAAACPRRSCGRRSSSSAWWLSCCCRPDERPRVRPPRPRRDRRGTRRQHRRAGLAHQLSRPPGRRRPPGDGERHQHRGAGAQRCRFVSASRPELKGQGRRLLRLAGAAALGGAAGAALLLSTPSSAFERIVPWLIAGASIALLVSARPASWRRRARAQHPDHRDPWWLPIGTFAIAIYGGYFGAAAGVMMLAMYLLTTGEGLPRGNALRNVVLGIANSVAAVGFILFAPIAWSAALPLAIGLFAGGRLGPRVVRRAPQTLLRRLIAIAGLGLAIILGIQAYF